MYIEEKSKEPWKEHWGTPQVNGTQSDIASLTKTDYLWTVRYDLNQFKATSDTQNRAPDDGAR